MNYLITGGAGFSGSYLAEVLLARGGHMTAIDDLPTGPSGIPVVRPWRASYQKGA